MKVTSLLAAMCLGLFGAWGLLHPRELPARAPAPHWVTTEGEERILHSPAGYQTVSRLDGRATGRYYDVGSYVARLRPNATSIVLLGLGGGEMLRAARRALPAVDHPHLKLVGVEIDPATAELAISEFHVDELGVQVVLGDAIDWPSSQPARSVSILMVDVYEDSVLPAQFQRLSFFADCYHVLEPDGLLVYNVGPLSKASPVQEQMQVLFKVRAATYGPNTILLGEKR